MKLVGEGRRSREDNDQFFTCSLIDYISRKTRNVRSAVVNGLGRENIARIYDLADVYHCDIQDRVADDFIRESGLTVGSFDNVGACLYSIPTHWDIGKVYMRLIRMVAAEEKRSRVDVLMDVYNSFVSPLIDDYNSSFYYENPGYIFECYRTGEVL